MRAFEDILIVTGGRNSGDFLRLLANGKEFGLKHINYTYQEGEGGIADALGAGRTFRRRQQDLRGSGRQHHRRHHSRRRSDDFETQERGAKILLKEVHDAERFGVAEIRGDRIVGIEEKPRKPEIELRGHRHLHVRRHGVRQRSRTLMPSRRGELEITDVNNAYIREGTMTFNYLDGWWTDAGTFESLLRAANLVHETHAQEERSAGTEPWEHQRMSAMRPGSLGIRCGDRRSYLRTGHRQGDPLADRPRSDRGR